MFRWNFFGDEARREDEALLMDNYDDLNHHADAGEESLLDDVIDSNDPDFEVVVEKHRDDIEVTRPDRPSVHSLYDNIQACIAMLEEARVHAEETVIEQTHQKYVNAALLIGGSALAVISPSILISLLIRHWYEVYQQLELSFADQLSVLREVMGMLEKKYIEVYNQYRDLWNKAISPQLYEWFNRQYNNSSIDEYGVIIEKFGTCHHYHLNYTYNNHQTYDEGDVTFLHGYPKDVAHYIADSPNQMDYARRTIHEAFCTIGLKKSHDFSYCNDIAATGCEIITNATKTDPIIAPLHDEFSRIDEKLNGMLSEYKRLETCQKQPFACEYTGSIITGALSQGTLIGASAIAVAVLLKRAKIKSDEYKHNIRHAHDIEVCVRNPEHANAIMALTNRLGINTNDLTVEELIEQLRTHANDINARWKAKTAFLGGQLRPEASTHLFFNNDVQGDIQRRIMYYADLLPQNAVRR